MIELAKGGLVGPSKGSAPIIVRGCDFVLTARDVQRIHRASGQFAAQLAELDQS